MVNVNDIAITSLETITCFDVLTGDFKFMIDELQSATLSQGQETADIVGKQGRKLNKMKRNKTVTVSGNNGLVSAGLLAEQVGSEFHTENSAEIMWTDYLTVSGNTATTTYKAIGTTGAEIIELYTKTTAGVARKELTQGTATAEGTFKYTPSTKTLNFTNVADGTEIVVVYKRHVKADVLVNESDKYSGKVRMYIDAIGEDSCANVYHVQFLIPKADFNGEFDFEMGDNQTIHTFEAEALAGSCGAGGELWKMTVFDNAAVDAA